MKRVLATIVSALVALAFAGVASAQQRYGTDTHPPIIEEQPGLKADTGGTEHKAKKKKKKTKKSKKQKKEDMGTTGTAPVTTPDMTAPNTTAPTPPETPPQPEPVR